MTRTYDQHVEAARIREISRIMRNEHWPIPSYLQTDAEGWAMRFDQVEIESKFLVVRTGRAAAAALAAPTPRTVCHETTVEGDLCLLVVLQLRVNPRSGSYRRIPETFGFRNAGSTTQFMLDYNRALGRVSAAELQELEWTVADTKDLVIESVLIRSATHGDGVIYERWGAMHH